MKSISVLIPTAGRPALLRTALRSVEQQTALDAVAEVVVSENLGDRASEQVCAEFPQVPIRYIFREPKLSAVQHGMHLVAEPIAGTYTAVLHDDDWWAPEHLDRALRALRADPEAAAYQANSFTVTGESTLLTCGENTEAWFGAGFPKIDEIWRMSRRDVLVASMFNFMAHYSTMVTRTDALIEAMHELTRAENPYDNDRMMTFALTRSGPLLFNPIPTAFYRFHAEQDSVSFRETSVERLKKTSKWLVETSGESWLTVAELMLERLRKAPPKSKDRLRNSLYKPWCAPTIWENAGNEEARVRMDFEEFDKLVPLHCWKRCPDRVWKQLLRHPRKTVMLSLGFHNS